MNYLELCKKVCRRVGVVDNFTTVQNPDAKDIEKVIAGVRDAWIFIQKEERDWSFLVGRADVSTFQLLSGITSVGQDVYNIPDLVDIIFFTLDGNLNVPIVTEHQVAMATASNPSKTGQPEMVCYISSTGKIQVYPIPTVTHTIVLVATQGIQVLVNDNDIPIIHKTLHDVIYYAALQGWSFFDSDPELAAEAGTKYPQIFSQLQRDYLPVPYIA